MKTCPKCKEEKEEDEFYWKIKSKNLKQSECKNCTKIMVTNHYKNNKKYYKDKTQHHSELKSIYLKELKLTLKCSKCGENHPSTLDFHHLEPNKKILEISALVKRNWSIENIKIEIGKCIVLCANCHRKLHWEEKYGSIV